MYTSLVENDSHRGTRGHREGLLSLTIIVIPTTMHGEP